MNNIYNAIQNLYNMDKTTWQEVIAELYNLVSNIENKFDLFELKFGSLLGEQIIKELKKMYDDGSLASLINDKLLQDINEKVDTFKTEVSEQLEHNTNIINNTLNVYISNYPRLQSEDDDSKRIQRAIEFLNSKGGGILHLEGGQRYYLKYRHEYGCFIKTYPNISIEGNNAILYVDNSSESSMSGMIKCLDIQNATYRNIIFDTTLITIIDDTSFYDCFYLRYVTKGNINVHFDGIKTLGKAYQYPLNVAIYNEDVETIHGFNVTVKNCEIFQTGYPTTINNLKYENVTYNVDLDVKRPSWVDGYAQTPFKFSAKSGYNTGIEMINCTVNIEGTRNPIVLFEVMRCDVKIVNLKVNKNSSVPMYFNIGTATNKDKYGVSNKETKLIMENCDLSEYCCYYNELSNVILNNCIIGKSNALNSVYNVANKQSTLAKANGKVTLNNCTIKDTTGRITDDSGDTEVILNNCFISYDRSKAPSNGFNLGTNSSMTVNNCIFEINGTGGDYLFAISNSKSIIINGMTVKRGTFTGITDDYLIWLNGNIDTVSIQNYYNPLRQKGSPLYRKNTSVITNLNVENEKIILSENWQDYEIKIVNGVLTTTQL